MKKYITVQEIWDHIIDSDCKPRPLKYVLDEVIDKINVIAGNKSIDEIVKDIVIGEELYKNLIKDLGTSGKELVYDNLTVRKKVLFPHLPDVVHNWTKIEKTYYLQRFINEHGLPPYLPGQKNMPDKQIVKRPKEKLQRHCPNCGILLTGKR